MCTRHACSGVMVMINSKHVNPPEPSTSVYILPSGSGQVTGSRELASREIPAEVLGQSEQPAVRMTREDRELMCEQVSNRGTVKWKGKLIQ
ncbi:hypothetical protein BaRGS_00021644 [Batillaria attramentaria]|uniref:Uncharacterized protein n=1 Tax=Batillaria attramentaria TaxID=370345 RepID=A0ABD0KJA7_9CAEN